MSLDDLLEELARDRMSSNTFPNLEGDGCERNLRDSPWYARLNGKIDSQFLDEVVCEIDTMWCAFKYKEGIECVIEIKRLCDEFKLHERDPVGWVTQIICMETASWYLVYIEPYNDLTAHKIKAKIKVMSFDRNKATLEEVPYDGGTNYEKEVEVTNSTEALRALQLQIPNMLCQDLKIDAFPNSGSYVWWDLAFLSCLIEPSPMDGLQASAASLVNPFFEEIAMAIYKAYKDGARIKG